MPHRETPLNFQVTNWVLTRCSFAGRSLDPLSGKNVFGRAWDVGSLLITREEKIEKERERERAVRSCFTANVLADVVVVVTHALTATSRLERLEIGRLRSRAECSSMLKLK